MNRYWIEGRKVGQPCFFESWGKWIGEPPFDRKDATFTTEFEQALFYDEPPLGDLEKLKCDSYTSWGSAEYLQDLRESLRVASL